MIVKKRINKRPVLKRPSNKLITKPSIKKRPITKPSIKKRAIGKPSIKKRAIGKPSIKKRAITKVSIKKKSLTTLSVKKFVNNRIVLNTISRKMKGKSVAIVGNSKNILENKYGKEIDNHDHVVRFNWSSTENISEYTGNKQTFRFCIFSCILGRKSNRHPKNIISDYNMYQKFKNLNIIVITANEKLTNDSLNRHAKKHNVDTISNNIYSHYINLQNYNSILKKLKCPYKLKKLPQVGLCATLLICSNRIKPDLYGFDLNYGKTNVGYPWTTVNHKKISHHHDHSSEFKILKYLNSKKLIKIHS